MEDKVYLSYKNICLRNSDVECFKNWNQLNDMCISFYFEYLNPCSNILLFDPAAVSTIVYFEDCIDELNEYFPVNLETRDYIFLPVNDNTNKYNAGGGSHWALLVYQKSDDKFYYLDSMLSYIENTTILCEKISKMMGKKKFEVICPLVTKYQDNTYDCGMFVLAFTELIIEYVKTNKLTENCFDAVFDNLNQKYIKDMRIAAINIINKLKNDK